MIFFIFRPDIGEIQIAYKFAQGPYKDSGMLFTEVHTLLPLYRTIGVYYDDPNTVSFHSCKRRNNFFENLICLKIYHSC